MNRAALVQVLLEKKLAFNAIRGAKSSMYYNTNNSYMYKLFVIYKFYHDYIYCNLKVLKNI